MLILPYIAYVCHPEDGSTLVETCCRFYCNYSACFEHGVTCTVSNESEAALLC